jgi:hypothetical protein
VGGQHPVAAEGGGQPVGGFILGSVFALVRKWFDGAGWYVGLAVALFTFALLAVFLTLQSSDIVLWTGQHVTGTEQGGIVYYRWHGDSYSLDATGNGSSNAVSVYLDPGNPSNAMIDNAFDRAVAVLLIGVPVAGGVVLLILGSTRNYRWARRNAKRASEFRYLAHLRGRAPVQTEVTAVWRGL